MQFPPFYSQGISSDSSLRSNFFLLHKKCLELFLRPQERRKREKVKYVIKSEHINNSRKHQLYVEREESKNTQVH